MELAAHIGGSAFRAADGQFLFSDMDPLGAHKSSVPGESPDLEHLWGREKGIPKLCAWCYLSIMPQNNVDCDLGQWTRSIAAMNQHYRGMVAFNLLKILLARRLLVCLLK